MQLAATVSLIVVVTVLVAFILGLLMDHSAEV